MPNLPRIPIPIAGQRVSDHLNAWIADFNAALDRLEIGEDHDDDD